MTELPPKKSDKNTSSLIGTIRSVTRYRLSNENTLI